LKVYIALNQFAGDQLKTTTTTTTTTTTSTTTKKTPSLLA